MLLLLFNTTVVTCTWNDLVIKILALFVLFYIHVWSYIAVKIPRRENRNIARILGVNMFTESVRLKMASRQLFVPNKIKI